MDGCVDECIDGHVGGYMDRCVNGEFERQVVG